MSVTDDAKAKGTQADRAGNPPEKREQSVGFGVIPFGSTGQPEEGVRAVSYCTGGVITGYGDDWLASPHNHEVSYATVERSWPLQAVISSFVANIYSSQVTVKIKVDPGTKEGKKQIRRWLLFKRKGRRPAERDLTKVYKEVEDKLEYEHATLEAWMSNAGLEEPLSIVQAMVGMDTIAGGAGYMELLRDRDGVPSKVLFCPGRYIRTRPQSGLVSFKNNVWDNPLTHRLERTYQRFRSYGLIPINTNGQVVYFRNNGDPRVLSRGTGRFYKNHAELKSNPQEKYSIDQVEYTHLPSTELIPFVRRTPWSEDHGSLPWSGGYVNAVGLRECEEVDRQLLNGSRMLPLLLISIAGGQGLTPAQQKKWAAEWRKGRESGEFSVAFFQALADQGAMGGGSEGQPKMTVTNTRQALVDEGLGLGYMKGAVRGVLGSFRYPRVAIGQDEDINHATAKHMMRTVESQVHDPEREWFYGTMNRAILPGLGLSLVEMQSLPRRTKDLEELSSFIKNVQDVSKPEELRSMLREALGGVFGDVDEDWVDIPLRVIMAMAQNKDSEPGKELFDGDDPTKKSGGSTPPGFGG